MGERALTPVQQQQLVSLLDAVGFGGVLRGMAQLAEQWSEDENVQPSHRADLVAVAGQLDDLARLVTDETVLV